MPVSAGGRWLSGGRARHSHSHSGGQNGGRCGSRHRGSAGLSQAGGEGGGMGSVEPRSSRKGNAAASSMSRYECSVSLPEHLRDTGVPQEGVVCRFVFQEKPTHLRVNRSRGRSTCRRRATWCTAS